MTAADASQACFWMAVDDPTLRHAPAYNDDRPPRRSTPTVRLCKLLTRLAA